MQSIIKNNRVQLVQSTAAEAPETPVAKPASPQAACRPGKGARLVQVDGQVRAIEVVCSCGETTVLELEYGNRVAQSPAPTEETS